jgi:hypothetical protein
MGHHPGYCSGGNLRNMHWMRGRSDERDTLHGCATINSFVARFGFWWDWYLSTNPDIAYLIASVKIYFYMYSRRGKGDDKHPFHGCASINNSVAHFGFWWDWYLSTSPDITRLIALVKIYFNMYWMRAKETTSIRFTDAPVLITLWCFCRFDKMRTYLLIQAVPRLFHR